MEGNLSKPQCQGRFENEHLGTRPWDRCMKCKVELRNHP